MIIIESVIELILLLTQLDDPPWQVVIIEPRLTNK
jgi:hypothetical protein